MIGTHNLPIPDRLIKSFGTKGVVAFIGAGVSINAGLPSWGQLIEQLFNEFGKTELTSTEYDVVKRHIDQGDYLLVADYLKSKLIDSRYFNFIEEKFSTKKISRIHSALASIPFEGYLTTNYDELITYADNTRLYQDAITWQDNLTQRKILKGKFILHVHGKSSAPDSIILTSNDFDKLRYSNTNATFWETIKTIFQTHRVIFIGYSLNDPDINSFISYMRYLFHGNLNEHHVLIPNMEDNPLYKYKIEKNLGLDPIYISSDGTKGETIISWLEKLKTEIERVNGSVKHKYEEHKTIPSKLLNEFIQYLLDNHIVNNSILNIASEFGLELTYGNVNKYDFWYSSILKMSDDTLRSFVIRLLDNNTNVSVLKRVKFHLP